MDEKKEFKKAKNMFDALKVDPIESFVFRRNT